MEIYKTKIEYSRKIWIHIQSANKREKNWRLMRLTVQWKKVWYIDTLEIVKYFINNL